MSDGEYYSYQLEVAGSPKDQKKVFELLGESDVLGKYLEPCGPEDAPYSIYECPEIEDEPPWTFEWNETDQENMLHDIAVKVPGVTLNLFGQCESDESYGFHKRFHGDMYQESHTVTFIPPLKDGADIPFSERYTARSNTQPEQEKMYVLIEEYEGEDTIREFNILAVSRDVDGLKKLLQAKVEKDEYGLIAQNGIWDDDDLHFRTEYADGFVEYSITAVDVLSKEQLQALLHTPEYDTEFKRPDNLRVVLSPILRDAIEHEGYGDIDVEEGLDVILTDKSFLAEIKNTWWFDEKHIDDDNKPTMNAVTQSLLGFVQEKLKEDPVWFETIRAAEPFVGPSNLKDILVDAIYDVSRDHHLPVHDAGREADLIMRGSAFRSLFQDLGTQRLEDGTEQYQHALWACYDFVQERYAPEHEHPPARPKLDTLLANAVQRKDSQPQTTGIQPEKER